MDRIEETLRSIYMNAPVSYEGRNGIVSAPKYGRNAEAHFLAIPVRENTFELPLFVLDHYIQAYHDYPQMDALVAELTIGDYMPKYKTVNRYMQDVLENSFSKIHLISLKAENGHDIVTYYGTRGLILNQNLEPVLTCSWEMGRYQDAQGIVRHRFLKPMLRIHPDCYLQQDDTMRKFIVRKLLPCALNSRFLSPPTVSIHFDTDSTVLHKVKAEIGHSPFTHSTVSPPEFSITDQELLQVACNYPNEFIQ